MKVGDRDGGWRRKEGGGGEIAGVLGNRGRWSTIKPGLAIARKKEKPGEQRTSGKLHNSTGWGMISRLTLTSSYLRDVGMERGRLMGKEKKYSSREGEGKRLEGCGKEAGHHLAVGTLAAPGGMFGGVGLGGGWCIR